MKQFQYLLIYLSRRAGLMILSIGLLIFYSGTLESMNDPEVIQWSTENDQAFINSAFFGVLGRNALPEEMNAWLDTEIHTKSGRSYLFWSLVGSIEYRAMFGYLTAPYYVYWNTRIQNTDYGTTLCHCYYFAKFSNGFMPSPQYIGINAPMGPFNFGVARAVVRMYASYDSRTCTLFDCGYTEPNTVAGNSISYDDCVNKYCPSCVNSISLLDVSADPNCEACKQEHNQEILDCVNGITSPQIATNNMVYDPNFLTFGNSGSPWGQGTQAWISSYAQSSAMKVDLASNFRPSPEITTALLIQNNSGRGPHVYGTTVQKVKVTKGQSYEISLMASAENLGSNSGVLISVDSQWKVRPLRLKQGTYSWTTFKGRFTAKEDHAYVRIISEDIGKVYITALTLTPEYY